MDLLSAAPNRVSSLLGLTSRLGCRGGRNVTRRELGNRALNVVFRGSSAEAEISFRANVCRLNNRTLFLSGHSLRVKHNRPVRSATEILSHCVSNVVVEAFRRSRIRTLTGCNSVPVVGNLASFYRPYRILTSLVAMHRRGKRLSNLGVYCVNSNGGVTGSLVINKLGANVRMSITYPRKCEPSDHILSFTGGCTKFSVFARSVRTTDNTSIVFASI